MKNIKAFIAVSIYDISWLLSSINETRMSTKLCRTTANLDGLYKISDVILE